MRQYTFRQVAEILFVTIEALSTSEVSCGKFETRLKSGGTEYEIKVIISSLKQMSNRHLYPTKLFCNTYHGSKVVELDYVGSFDAWITVRRINPTFFKKLQICLENPRKIISCLIILNY